MSNKRVVVTGGRGFVGTYFIEELRRAWSDVDVETWDLPEVDITNPDTYTAKLVEHRPDWLIHLAAVSSVPAGLENPERAFAVNTQATQALLEAVPDSTKVFVTSTADIYGQGSFEPLAELPLSDARPENPYAKSKWEMEKMIEGRFNSQVLRVRPFPHIGPGQRLGFVTADFASQIAAIELGKQEPVIRVGNLEAERDFTDVRDVVRAYRLLIEQGEIGSVYHVASGKATRIQEILDILISLSALDISIEQDPERMRPSDIQVLVGDATKLRSLTGWEPTIPLTTSLQDILNWWRARA